MINSPIKVEEFQSRRASVLRSLKGAVGLVQSGNGAPPLRGIWEADSFFYYLTGIRSESGASILFDGTNPNPKRRVILFLKPIDPEFERWDGYREMIGEDMREGLGFETVMRTTSLPTLLTQALTRTKRAACLHPFAVYDAPPTSDLTIFRKVAERVPGLAIEDRTDVLPAMRAVKSRAEQTLVRKAVHATQVGYEAAMRTIAPGANERDVQRALEEGFVAGGASRPAYNSIVGSGLNATVLHYHDNDATLSDGELLLIDAGAEFGGYCADVTRVIPVSGRFTKEQRAMYDIVLRALDAGIRAVRPGASFVDVDRASRDVIEHAGLGDAFIHGIGHHIGIDVHDPQTNGKLEPGMILTVEPGIYLKDQRIGIRIEDDVLVTSNGRVNLTREIARTADEVEAAMKSARRALSSRSRSARA
ncbi:MAG: aminopeptidase P family protein [Phycisphaeraceae bacterium]|nr:aminopeptidase P family protein [Phycisphaeraceae bacterium]MCW5762385.1 aminopeptidase P family protein [Phycisphaeraceae bacterium]